MEEGLKYREEKNYSEEAEEETDNSRVEKIEELTDKIKEKQIAEKKTPGRLYTNSKGQNVAYTPQGREIVLGSTSQGMILVEFEYLKRYPELSKKLYEEALRRAENREAEKTKQVERRNVTINLTEEKTYDTPETDKTLASNNLEGIVESEPDVSSGEVASELGRMVGRGITRGIVGTLNLAGRVVFGLFGAPTTIRKIDGSISDAKCIGLSVGLGLEFCPILYATLLAKYTGDLPPALSSNYIKHAFLLWTATNLASGAYEIFRYTKNKLREKKKDELLKIEENLCGV